MSCIQNDTFVKRLKMIEEKLVFHLWHKGRVLGLDLPVAVGDRLPDMPIFLTPDHYVPCPLEATYQVTWGVFPAALKGPLELPPK